MLYHLQQFFLAHYHNRIKPEQNNGVRCTIREKSLSTNDRFSGNVGAQLVVMTILLSTLQSTHLGFIYFPRTLNSLLLFILLLTSII